eukprot:2333457-Amphidinium_carterae.1
MTHKPLCNPQPFPVQGSSLHLVPCQQPKNTWQNHDDTPRVDLWTEPREAASVKTLKQTSGENCVCS